MSSISITTCSFYLRKTNSKTSKGVYNLNHLIPIYNSDGIVDKNINVMEMFKTFFKSHKLIQIDNNRQQSYSCEYFDNDVVESKDFVACCARIYSGEYGETSELINIETGESVHKKKIDEVDVKPFYIFIVIPKDNSKVKVQRGILIFQNIGSLGIKTITLLKMQEFFSTHYNVSIQCNCIAPKLFVEKILRKDKVKKFTLITHHKSKDFADNLSIGYGKESRILTDLCLNDDKWKKIIHSIKYAAQSKFNLFEFEGIKYDSVKIGVEIGEHMRTIDVHNIDKLSIIEYVPNEVKSFDGHPDKNKLKEYISTIIDDYLNDMVLTISESEVYND